MVRLVANCRLRAVGLEAAETAAMAAVVAAPTTGSQVALERARAALEQGQAAVDAATAESRAQLRVLGEALYQTIGMKLSVPLYGVRRCVVCVCVCVCVFLLVHVINRFRLDHR